MLWEALESHQPDLLAAVTLRGLLGLSSAEREKVHAALLKDFILLGRQPDDEPNIRGRQAEDLIDFIRRIDREPDAE